MLERVQALHNGAGFAVQSTANAYVRVTAADSIAFRSFNGAGFYVSSTANAADFVLVNSKAIDNVTGVQATFTSQAALYLSQSTVVGTYSLSDGAHLRSYRNNVLTDGPTGTGTIEYLDQQ
jgi:hypothetical protein